MVISAIWSILPGQNRGPYIRNPVYVVMNMKTLLHLRSVDIISELLLMKLKANVFLSRVANLQYIVHPPPQWVQACGRAWPMGAPWSGSPLGKQAHLPPPPPCCFSPPACRESGSIRQLGCFVHSSLTPKDLTWLVIKLYIFKRLLSFLEKSQMVSIVYPQCLQPSFQSQQCCHFRDSNTLTL